MELSLQQRIEARLAKYKQSTQSGYQAILPPTTYSGQILRQSNLHGVGASSVQELGSQLQTVNSNYTASMRELAEARTKLL